MYERQRFDVARLRKHVERLDVGDTITARHQVREIARQGRRVAGQIPHLRSARAHQRVERLGVLADEDPPGPGSHPVEDNGRRISRADRRLVPEVGVHPHEHLAQVAG